MGFVRFFTPHVVDSWPVESPLSIKTPPYPAFSCPFSPTSSYQLKRDREWSQADGISGDLLVEGPWIGLGERSGYSPCCFQKTAISLHLTSLPPTAPFSPSLT